MEERLEQETEPIMTQAQIDRKLLLEKRARWYKIELLVTLRESQYLGIEDEIMQFGGEKSEDLEEQKKPTKGRRGVDLSSGRKSKSMSTQERKKLKIQQITQEIHRVDKSISS